MLSHGNILSAVTAAQSLIQLKESDVHVSYIPLAHIFESVVQVSQLAARGSITFFQNDFKKLVDNFKDAIMEQATANKLSSLEKVKSPLVFEFELDETLQGSTVANDCITPTMKIKRNIITKRYLGQVTQSVRAQRRTGEDR